ncbi:MAG: O-antigen ligase domain-containing protein, partial [Pseudanabaena sp.]
MSQFSKKSQLLQPTEAWFVISLFIFVILILFFAGGIGIRILGIVFPLGSFLVAWYLYFRYPFLYIGFVWWLFFLTPFVRRVADFRTGTFTDPNPILLAPTVAILVTANTMYCNIPKAREQSTIPFVLAIASVVYGYCVGLLNPSTTAMKATIAFLGWLTPVIFGYHLYVNWRRYPEYSKVIQKIFLWGCLIVGVYGIYQYVVAPEWDRLWLVGSKMDSSAGSPVPYGMRVWSTLNSPGPFADMMATALLVLFSCKSPLVTPAAIAGTLSFLFSAVRTGWLGW